MRDCPWTSAGTPPISVRNKNTLTDGNHSYRGPTRVFGRNHHVDTRELTESWGLGPDHKSCGASVQSRLYSGSGRALRFRRSNVTSASPACPTLPCSAERAFT